VPNTTELDNRLREVELHLAEVKGGRTAWLTILTVMSMIAIGLGSWALLEIHKLDIQVTAINTLLTQQLPKLALLHVGQDPTDAAEKYRLAATVLARSSEHHRTVNSEAAKELGVSLAGQAPQHSSLPDYWKLASLVIDAKDGQGSTRITTSLPNCLDNTYPPISTEFDLATGKRLNNPNDVNRPLLIIFTWKNCVLHLDASDFWGSNVGKKIIGDRSRHPAGAAIGIVLTDGVVIYDGGPLLPVNRVLFNDCKFDVNFPNVPPPPMRKIGNELLRADLSHIQVDVTDSPSPS
jgi:hypothetical protein